MANLESQKYRASVAGMILKDFKEILMVQNTSFSKDEWDFPKGGMNLGEEEEETLKREIEEELGLELKYSIIRKSSCSIIYTWPKEKQIIEGLRGQARVSFWLNYESGRIHLDNMEIRNFKWIFIKDLELTLKQSNWPEEIIKVLLFDLNLLLL